VTTTSSSSVDTNELAWPALEGSGMSPGNGRYHAYGLRNLEEIGRRYGLTPDAVEMVDALAHVIPFRVNDYVLENMVDWKNVPEDPLYQLVFPQPGMLSDGATGELVSLRRQGWPRGRTQQLVRSIRDGLNPHPSGQRELNVPYAGDNPIPGLQHKYTETVLYFPAHGQTCHAYCTYCFRWAQFVGDADLKFAAPGPAALLDYLRAHPRVTDVLVTGGDPLIMSTARLSGHVEPLLQVGSLQTVRFGTKALAYWPDRFVGDADAADLLRLFERIVATGRTCAVMAHFSHPRELETSVVTEAIRRIRGTGAQIYCQAPLIARVNDDAGVWNSLWRHELRLGAVPYYMFVERDTGPHDYFQVPLARAVQIFQDAYRRLPGLARTVRGPVMSTTPGKVMVDGATPVDSGLQLSLRFLQAREPGVVGTPFTARCHPDTSWLTDVDSFDAPPRVLAALQPARSTGRSAS
jgi:KamA family protein